MSNNDIPNYFIGISNNNKNIPQHSQVNHHINLFKRNNKLNFDIPKPNSNKTTNNFNLNFFNQRQQLLNRKETQPIYNTYYSNFQSQANNQFTTLNYNDEKRINNINNNNYYAQINNVSNSTDQKRNGSSCFQLLPFFV